MLKSMSFCRLISRELDIYDKNSRCIMTEGEYELLLSEQQQAVTNGDTSSSIKNGTWESVSIFKSIPSPNNLCTQSTDQSKLLFSFLVRWGTAFRCLHPRADPQVSFVLEQRGCWVSCGAPSTPHAPGQLPGHSSCKVGIKREQSSVR